MVTYTTNSKYLMTIVLYNRNNVLVQPISPAFVNQAEPVLNREDGMYVYLCICVWHLFFFGASLRDAGGSCVVFLPNEHPYGMNYLNEKAPFPTGNAPNLS